MEDKEILNLVEMIDKKKARLFEGAKDEEISSFEKNNNIKLPEGYKEWLKISDGGELYLPAGIQLYGVTQKPLIDVSNPDKPNENYIVIGSLASGDPILCEKTNERISIYNHEAAKIEDGESFENFFSFINELKSLLGEDDD